MDNIKAPNKPTKAKTKCFFCKYELKSKPKLINYKNTTVKVCISCNSKKFKFCATKYKSKNIECTACQKAVIYNSCILCSCCDHFIHQKCTRLSKEDIADIEKSQNEWTCKQCYSDIFPFSELTTRELQKQLTPVLKTSRQMAKNRTKPVLKQQCFACHNTVPRTHYKNKYIFYNHRKVKLCVTCSKDQSRLKTKSAIEYIECTICDKSVNYESILCNLCLTWVHPDCAGLNKKDLSTIGEESYGDWYCPPCTSTIFPFQTNDTLEKSTVELTNEFKTYTDCS